MKFVMMSAVGLLTVAALAEAKTPAIVNGVHTYTPKGYVVPKEPEVRAKLEWFRDQKLALMMHFGMYSQLGIHESWPLVDKAAKWSRSLVDWEPDGEKFKAQYWSMAWSFNPVRFEPQRWAKIAKDNGFRYLIFTTKHHDGFCMFDSKYSDFKVTNPKCPFSSNPRADIVRNVFDAFRAEGLGIAAYFSKPDWHHPDYWEDRGIGHFTTPRPTYNVKERPEKWQRFREYTRNQILELVRNYGPIDVLWLDGGVVNRWEYDIRIDEIVAEARKFKPDLISADRTCGGPSENVITPEQEVPAQAMTVPWESCITMGTGFSYRYDETFKSPRKLIHLLVDVVAKGGNLALNVAPGPDGRLPRPAIERMEAMGKWLAKNGKAIYGTRIISPYRVGDWAFTVGKNGERYAIRLWKGNERNVRELQLPKELDWEVHEAIRLAGGATSPIAKRDGAGVFSFAASDKPDEFADAFELK